MIPLTAAAIADVVGGDAGPDTGARITGVSIDSRTTKPGDLFVPLPGANVDGHAHIPDALAAGAAAYLCAEDRPEAVDGPAGRIVVDDPLDALVGLGAWVRDEVDPLVVAITGSNGKTTTKDMAAAAIGAGRVTVANPGSYNNEIGLPLTLCLLTRETEVLVCEIGARGAGHIASAMPVLRPDVSIVTTVAGAHIGEFGSLEAIARAKSEIVLGLHEDGVAILNADVPSVAAMAELSPGRVITFGLGEDADLHPERVELDDTATATITVDGVTVTLPRPGVHQVGNALAALAAAREAGVPMEIAASGLASAGVSPWRMEVRRRRDGLVVLNDAYNANPHSTTAAIDTLAAMRVEGRRLAVLGHMAELGAESAAGHREVGAHAAAQLDGLVVVGAAADGIAEGAAGAGFDGVLHRAADVDEAVRIALDLAGPDDAVLIKGSRSAGLEVVAVALLEARP